MSPRWWAQPPQNITPAWCLKNLCISPGHTSLISFCYRTTINLFFHSHTPHEGFIVCVKHSGDSWQQPHVYGESLFIIGLINRQGFIPPPHTWLAVQQKWSGVSLLLFCLSHINVINNNKPLLCILVISYIGLLLVQKSECTIMEMLTFV